MRISAYFGYVALAVAGAIALVGALLLIMQASADPGVTASGALSPPAAPPRPDGVRFVCSLTNEDAGRALVAGADGGIPVTTSNGATYWLFGDTLYHPQSGREIGPNSIARAGGVATDGCPRLEYHAQDGVAKAFLEKDGALTVWPSGAFARDDGTIDVYVVYVYGSGPYAYWIGEVGVARLHPGTMSVEVLERSLWDEASGFVSIAHGAQPLEFDTEGRLRVIVYLRDHAPVLARVDAARLHVASAYEYWTGGDWSEEPSEARPLWPREPAASDIERLASFESGPHIAWNDHLQQYVAVMNDGAGAIGARTADRLEGPWSDRVRWLDCDDFAEPAVPVCYGPVQHAELSSGRGRQIYLAVTRMATYDIVIFELTLGEPKPKEGG